MYGIPVFPCSLQDTFVLSCICNYRHSLTLCTIIRSFVLKLTRGFKSSNCAMTAKSSKQLYIM